MMSDSFCANRMLVSRHRCIGRQTSEKASDSWRPILKKINIFKKPKDSSYSGCYIECGCSVTVVRCRVTWIDESLSKGTLWRVSIDFSARRNKQTVLWLRKRGDNIKVAGKEETRTGCLLQFSITTAHLTNSPTRTDTAWKCVVLASGHPLQQTTYSILLQVTTNNSGYFTLLANVIISYTCYQI